MKRLVPILLLAAGAACADPHGSFSFGIGPNNDATNSNYTTTIGYSAGSEARSDTRDFIGGTFAGAMSYNIKRSVGLGYGSFYMASNLTDCVAIGDRAGARWRGADGWVQVGDAFAYTNGYLNIKAPTGGYDIAGILRPGEGGSVGLWANGVRSAEFARGGVDIYGGLSLVNGEYGGSLTCGLASCRDLTVNGCGLFSADSTGTSISASGNIQTTAHVEAQTIGSQTNSTGSLVLYGYSYNVTLAMDEQDHLCVYTNGVKAGRLSIVPDP